MISAVGPKRNTSNVDEQDSQLEMVIQTEEYSLALVVSWHCFINFSSSISEYLNTLGIFYLLEKHPNWIQQL